MLGCRSSRVDIGCAYPREGAYRSTRGHRNLDVLRAAGDHALWKVGDFDAFCNVVIA